MGLNQVCYRAELQRQPWASGEDVAPAEGEEAAAAEEAAPAEGEAAPAAEEAAPAAEEAKPLDWKQVLIGW